MLHVEGGAWAELVQALDTLAEVVLDTGDGRHDGGGPKPVGDEGEVGEVPLDGGVQQGLGPRVAQRAAVLVQEVHQLLGDGLGGQHEVLPPVLVHGVVVVPGHVLRNLPRRELRLTHVTEISCQMNCLS